MLPLRIRSWRKRLRRVIKRLSRLFSSASLNAPCNMVTPLASLYYISGDACPQQLSAQRRRPMSRRLSLMIELSRPQAVTGLPHVIPTPSDMFREAHTYHYCLKAQLSGRHTGRRGAVSFGCWRHGRRPSSVLVCMCSCVAVCERVLPLLLLSRRKARRGEARGELARERLDRAGRLVHIIASFRLAE